MKLACNYPRFGFPDSVNRGMFSVAFAIDNEEMKFELGEDAAILDINVNGKIPKATIRLSDSQKYPFILGINNTTDTAGQFTVEFPAGDGTYYQRTFNSNAKKNSQYSIQPTYPVDEIYGYVLNVSESIAGATIPAAEKNVGFTYEGATCQVSGAEIKWSGKIPYYKVNSALGRIAGNRVGIQFKAPEGANLEKSYFILDGKKYDFTALDKDSSGKDVLNWWPMVTTPGETKTADIVWMVNGTAYIFNYLVKIADDATFDGVDEALDN